AVDRAAGAGRRWTAPAAAVGGRRWIERRGQRGYGAAAGTLRRRVRVPTADRARLPPHPHRTLSPHSWGGGSSPFMGKYRRRRGWGGAGGAMTRHRYDHLGPNGPLVA